MKTILFLAALIMATGGGCSSTPFNHNAKNTGQAYCEQQCFSNSLTASEQFDCKRRCGEHP